MRSWRTHSSAMAPSSASENTLPVGLCGLLSSSTRVAGVIAAARASRSSVQSGASRVTTRSVAPAMATDARYES